MTELSKSYNPKEVEEKWYKFWKENNFFKADPKSSKNPYCIVIPPPNVTGVLHMGHALVETLQDVMIRYHKMMGYETLWVPGTDHAGISTQTIVEKHLFKTTNKRRKDFKREEFLKHVWEWKEDKEKNILNQLEKLGCSCDWSRLRFTMDQKNNEAVRHVFKKMFDEGLIYQGDYLVNWDPVTQTALADDEVEYEEIDSSLWFFKYPIAGEENSFVTIATTRPETMLGDTAIAVSPKDKRYKSLIGKKVVLPFVNREIPIIEDHYVDPSFGTGMVKITPAHDHNDYNIGIDHNLAMINIMTPNGKINENGGPFKGMTMLQAREEIVKQMKNLNLLDKIEPYKLRIGLSYRSKAIIEPFLSKQWFVKMTSFKDKLISAVKDKRVKIIPKYWENVYFHWIENLRDWCISRQLWWGHRIPIWYNKKDPNKIICFEKEGLPDEVKKDPDNWYQDEDVLDTWFSSALWPFSVLGWPENTEELKKFYPTSVLITAHDILFFWVARMILMGEYIMKEVPFHETFIHGLIYGKSYWRKDEDGSITYVDYEEKAKYDLGEDVPKDVYSKWEKMSKSKGNIIDPLEIINTYGTDAIRMALCSSVTDARQIDLDRRRFDEFKNFTNKIWNGARFVLQNIAGNDPLTKEAFKKGLDRSLFTLEDFWILSRVNRSISHINESLKKYDFDQAAICSYEFFWNDFCSYYLEIIKPTLFGKTSTKEVRENKQKLLLIILIDAIRMMHPFAPFITEELFQKIKELFSGIDIDEEADLYTQKTINALNKEACIVAPFPQLLYEKDISPRIEKDFSKIQEVIYTIRNIRGEMKVTPAEKIDLFLISKKEDDLKWIKENIHIIESLIRVNKITYSTKEEQTIGSSALIGKLKIFIPIPKDLIKKEKDRLLKEKEKLLKNLEKTQKQLSNKEFIEKAPDEVVKKMKSILENTEKELLDIKKKLNQYK